MKLKEIEENKQRLKEIIKTEPDSSIMPPEGQKETLQKLARKVGAGTRMVYVGSEGNPKACPAGIADLIDNIHRALNTATMIAMARIANRNFWVTMAAVLIALLSAAAAWFAALAR
jgi:hypothetical protein